MKPQTQLIMMVTLTGSFFLAEIIVGNITNSVALVADAFHMLSDLIAMLIALTAVILAKRNSSTKSNTFGWQRAEILGGLINGVFLLALCFTITIEAIERFFDPEEISDPKLLLIIGSVGLGVNLIGLLIFSVGGHGHSHGGHGHSHGGHGHSHGGNDQVTKEESKLEGNSKVFTKSIKPSSLEKGDKVVATRDKLAKTKSQLMFLKGEEIPVLDRINEHTYIGECEKVTGEFNISDVEMASEEEIFEIDPYQVKIQIGEVNTAKKAPQKEGIRAVFLHIAGDALGSVAVIISALVSLLTDFQYKQYLDPALSLVIAAIIAYSTVPLVRSTSMTLLQGVPKFDFKGLKKKILEIEGVESVHELHVWRLADSKLIGSAHIISSSDNIGPLINRVFHEFDIHSTTIQIEKIVKKNFNVAIKKGSKDPLLGKDEDTSETLPSSPTEESDCLLRCPPEICKESMCCPPEDKV